MKLQVDKFGVVLGVGFLGGFTLPTSLYLWQIIRSCGNI